MATQPAPTTSRRQLGAELRRLREQRGRTAADVSAQLGWSESKLTRIETAHTGVRVKDLEVLVDLFDVPEGTRARLRALAARSRQRAWWERYGDVLPDPYETYIGFEAEATSLYEFNATVVPGLLQTDEYAHAVLAVGPNDPEAAEQHVSVRMARRVVLTREPPIDLHVVLDEGVVRRVVGGAGAMRRQVRSLLEAAQRPNITIQVLEFSAGAHYGLAGSFILLGFPDQVGAPMVYCEGLTGGVFRGRSHEVSRYTEAFTALQAAALSPRKSEALLADVAQSYS